MHKHNIYICTYIQRKHVYIYIWYIFTSLKPTKTTIKTPQFNINFLLFCFDVALFLGIFYMYLFIFPLFMLYKICFYFIYPFFVAVVFLFFVTFIYFSNFLYVRYSLYNLLYMDVVCMLSCCTRLYIILYRYCCYYCFCIVWYPQCI